MGLALARSYEKVRDRIKDTKCCWVEGVQGWYHTFDPKIVGPRLLELNLEIDRLYRESKMDRLRSNWEPIPGASNT